jgi:hypothetical protein
VPEQQGFDRETYIRYTAGMDTTQVRLDTETAAALREIAAGFGYYVSRGLGAREVGNAAAMLKHLAERYREDPIAIRATLGPLLMHDEAVG